MRFCNPITFTKAGSIPAAVSCSLESDGVKNHQTVSGQPRLRERWPFLDDPDTPLELKALVTQRITRYHEYNRLYSQLRSCDSMDELSDLAGQLLSSYLDNQAIGRELDYYQKHKRVLGKHPMFRHFQQLIRLRSSSTKDLIHEQNKTRNNIWRVKSEMRKGDKPHLDGKRMQKLQAYELKLQEINRLLNE